MPPSSSVPAIQPHHHHCAHRQSRGNCSAGASRAAAKASLLLLSLACCLGLSIARAAGPPAAEIDTRAMRDLAAAPVPPSPDVQVEVQRLQQEIPDLMVKYNPETGGVNSIQSLSQPLSEARAGPPGDVAVEFLRSNRALFHLDEADLAQTRIAREYASAASQLNHVTLQQQVNGIDVFGSTFQVSVTTDGRVLKAGGDFISGPDRARLAVMPLVASADAIGIAANQAGVSRIYDSAVNGRVYFPHDAGELRLAWDVVVEDGDSPFVYHAVVDALSGEVLYLVNTTAMDHFPAHGLVFTNDGPQPSTPTSVIAGTVPRDDVAFSGAGFFPHDDPHYDWWNGGPRTTTSSNNVIAREDWDGDNETTPGFQPTAMPDEDFSFVLDLTQQPNVEDMSAQNLSSGIVNLFHRNNWLHDVLYKLGFDEASANFQDDNFGLGGTGGDPLLADAQNNFNNINMPNPGDNLCNAFFNGCQADGSNPRMTMLLCDDLAIMRDGSLDNSVIIHEFGHGVHHRIVPSTCNGGHQGMGEGWADYFAIALLAESDDDINGNYGVGHWLRASTGDGIRRQPYSTDQSVFTRTYADITDGATCALAVCSGGTTACNDDSDCPAMETCGTKPACEFHFECDAPPQPVDLGDCSPETHNTGELWAEALWLAHANLVIKYGFAVGNLTINTLVVEGMKLTDPDPSFLDARDGVLAADLALTGGVNQCLLWDAFARMGMGFSAATIDENDINPVEGFDTPAGCTPNIAINADTDFGDVCGGDTATTLLTVFNTGSGDLIVHDIARTSGSDEITLDEDPELPLAIGAGAHVDFTLRCEGLTAGVKTATFQISSNDADQPALDVEFSCTTPQPDLNVSIANEGNFGEVCPGDHADMDLTLLNQGACDLTITSIGLNPIGSNWELPDNTQYPLVLSPDADFAVPLRFDPNPGQDCSDVTPRTAVVTISSDSPGEEMLEIEVRGTMPCPDLVFDPEAFNGDFAFPPTVMDLDGSLGCYSERSGVVRNIGRCPLVISSITGFSGFSITAPTEFPVSLPPGEETLEVIVRFTPLSAGDPLAPNSFIGTLNIDSNDPDGTAVIQACGEGVAQSGIRVLVTDISTGLPVAVDEVDNITLRSSGINTPGPINLQFNDVPVQSAMVCGNTVQWHVDQETLPSTQSEGNNPQSSYRASAREGNLKDGQSFGLGQCEFLEFQLQLLDSDAEMCLLLPKGASCTNDGECCSGRCRGPAGDMTCK